MTFSHLEVEWIRPLIQTGKPVDRDSLDYADQPERITLPRKAIRLLRGITRWST